MILILFKLNVARASFERLLPAVPAISFEIFLVFLYSENSKSTCYMENILQASLW